MDKQYIHTLTKYILGFVLSLVITLTAYNMVVAKSMGLQDLFVILGVLAFSQMIVQLIFFLHLSDEVRPRLKLATLFCMATVLLIVVVGSLWIMQNLNYNMMQMSPEQKTQRMVIERDKGF
jgi:cytochrome o ubiquinol oxidase operon protein cyoD